MNPFQCDFPGCADVLLTVAGFRQHVIDAHGRVPCDYLDCISQYVNTPGLREHKNAMHLNKRYACSACGEGYWLRRNLYIGHVQTRPECRRGGVILEIRNGDGLYSNGVRYVGPIRGALIPRYFEAAKM